MKHITTDRPQTAGVEAVQTDTSEPEFESLMLPGIAELPELSKLPAWMRRPLERIKSIKRSP